MTAVKAPEWTSVLSAVSTGAGINMTFKIYCLMPASIGRAAKLLDEGL
ncbi:hypothetical protein ACFXPY_15065 [Streptomyces sp. NPDC059153]